MASRGEQRRRLVSPDPSDDRPIGLPSRRPDRSIGGIPVELPAPLGHLLGQRGGRQPGELLRRCPHMRRLGQPLGALGRPPSLISLALEVGVDDRGGVCGEEDDPAIHAPDDDPLPAARTEAVTGRRSHEGDRARRTGGPRRFLGDRGRSGLRQTGAIRRIGVRGSQGAGRSRYIRIAVRFTLELESEESTQECDGRSPRLRRTERRDPAWRGAEGSRR